MNKLILLLICMMLLTGVTPVQSQGQEKSGDDLAAKTQNQVGAMYSLPFKFSFDYGAENGEASFLNIHPGLAKDLPGRREDWSNPSS